MKNCKRVLIIQAYHNLEMLAGMSRYAREANWILNAFPLYMGIIPENWPADGLLTTNAFRPDLARFISQTAKKLPTVLHGCDDLGLGVPNVECDEHAMGRMAAQHLLDHEHRHFVCIRYSSSLHAIRRRDGFRDRLQEASYDCADFIYDLQGQKMSAWLRKRLSVLSKPIGLFAEDDLLAAMVIEGAIDIGWKVPDDLAVVGCGNIDLVWEFSPIKITSIMQPLEEQGYQAAAMLDALLSGKKLQNRNVVFPPAALIARESTNSVAATLELVKHALKYMSDQLGNPALDVGTVANSCGVSQRLLYKEFEKDHMSPPMTCLVRMRLRKAKDLLLANEQKIEAIAEACGFSNLRTLQRAFQREEGQSPSRWKQAQLRSFSTKR